jgi:glycosyltransferase involved in cell wall biosynthesis
MDNSAAMQKRVIFLTRSTSVAALLGNYSTASQAYEVSLISSLAEHVDTTVINIGSGSAIPETTESRNLVTLANGRTITYLSFGKISFPRIFGAVDFFKSLAGHRETAILTTGYHPNEMVTLLRVRSKSVGIYSIVFDTHVQGNSRMIPIKRLAANAYFEFGYNLLPFLSGVIVLNDLFVKTEKKPFRYLKTKIGARSVGCGASGKYDNTTLKILFAGTLNAENGVDLISEFLRRNPDADVEVTLAGYGELEEMVVEMAQRDPRLNFLGTLTDEVLTAEIAKSDLLLCLRDPESAVCQYAFPSKLIKFMSSGVPVISNEFPGLGKEYHPHLLLIKDFSAAALCELIEKLDTLDFRRVGDSARTYIEANHRWSDISLEILEFMFPFSQNGQLHESP